MKTNGRKWLAGVVLTAVCVACAAGAACAGFAFFPWGGGDDQQGLTPAHAAVGPAEKPKLAEGACGFAYADGAAHAAYIIDSAEKLRWLFEQAEGQDLSACYVLDFPASSVVDLTELSDTGVGDCKALGADHAACAAFSGHFDGRGATLKYKIDGSASLAAGGTGLFAYAKNAAVKDLNLDVETHTRSKSAATACLGGVFTDCTVERVTLSHTFTDIPEGALDAEGNVIAEAGDFPSAGLIAANLGGIVTDAAVRERVPEAGGLLHSYGGVARVNTGRIENCAFTAVSGAGALILNEAGGICHTVAEGGFVSGCTAEFPDNLTVGKYVGGAVSRMDGRDAPVAITGCSVQFSSAGKQAGAEFCGGIAGYQLGNSAIENCTAEGNTLIAGNYAAGIAGVVRAAAGQTARVFNCTANIVSVGTAVSPAGISSGGLVGVAAAEAGGTVEILDSAAYGSVYGGSYIGGAVGYIGFEGNGGLFLMRNTHAFGAEVSGTDNVGGAIGRVSGLADSNKDVVAVTDCSASPRVTATGLGGGGFAGFVGYNAAQSAEYPAAFSGCTAMGDVTAGQRAGGFVGATTASFTLTAQGLEPEAMLSVKTVFENCSAAGNTLSRGQHAGGFAGTADGSHSFTGCIASGAVSAANNDVGGFIGTVLLGGPRMAQNYENCKAFGTATGAATASDRGVGGFVGNSYNCARLRFYRCEAWGDAVSGTTTGGFGGYLLNQPNASYAGSGDMEFRECVSYGNATSYVNGGEVGGFLAWPRRGTMTIYGCTSYGGAKYGPEVTNRGDAGGFISALESRAIIENCASYAPYVEGTTSMSGSFVTMYTDNGAGTILRNNTYTVCSFEGVSLGVAPIWAGATSSTVAENSGNTGIAQSARPQNPSAAFSATVSVSGKTVTASFSGASAVTGALVSLHISLDGGRSWTQLAHAGAALIPLGSVPVGGTVGLNNFTFTYAAAAPPQKADVKVRAVYAAGFSRTAVPA